MTECRKIGRLIHLHREGERTLDEDRLVSDHVVRCEACAAILRSLEMMDAGLALARTAGPREIAPDGLVERTAKEIRGDAAVGRGGVLSGWFGPQPAILFALLCAVVFLAQQGRDAWEMRRMERRLAGLSGSGGSAQLTIADGVSEISGLLTPRAGDVGAPAVSRASAIPGFLIPGFGSEGLFREFAKKYPRLATVDPYDGIDERERKILATEGKAFLEEFQSLIRKGE